MEVQQTSPKRSRRSSKQSARSAIGWTPLDLVRVGSIGLIVAGPWYFAGAPWLSQYWMVWAALVLAALMACEIVRRIWLQQDIGKVAFPALSILFLGLASYAWVQSIPFFSVDSPGGWVPASVKIQRWFLGTPNTGLDARFNTTASVLTATSEQRLTETWADAKLALSVEPLHSRAAVGGMAMVSVMIWIGATAFQTRRTQLAVMILMTIMGLVFGLIGLAHVLSWERVNWLGLDSSTSFATFVSRNTAGGFMNVCLAGSIGLAAWAFSQPRDKEQRYSYGSESPGLRILHTVEDIFAQLTTLQICTLLSTSFILIAVFCTGSRGASISACVACIVAFLVSQNRKNQVGMWVFALVVIAIGLSGIYFFELDQRITNRFTDLAKAETFETDIHIGRLYIWSVALQAFFYFGVFGSGLGTFHFAHLPFQNPTGMGWYYHAESLYAQALVELGWFGVLAILATFAFCIRAIQKLRTTQTLNPLRSKSNALQFQPIFLIGLTLVISQAVHSFFDFALIVPAVFLPAGLMIGMVYGAARNKSSADKENVDELSIGISHRVSSQRLPKVEGPRFSNLVEQAPLAAVPMKRVGSKETVSIFIGCVGLMMLLWSSIRPIEAMYRVDNMNRWLQDQTKVTRASRIGSPSAYLAGLWGTPSISIYQVPDALRIMGESVLYVFRSQRLDQLDSIPGETASVTWEKTSPLLIRLAIAEKQALAIENGESKETFEKSVALDSVFGGAKQLARWEKARELIEKAHLQSPLDWRLTWGRLLLDRKLSVSEWNGWFDRSCMVSRHRPDTLFQIGVLGWQAAKDRDHVYPLWKSVMQLAYWLAPGVASIIAMDSSDSDVPTEIFPQIPYYLGAIAANPFDATRFPRTNNRLWERIGESAIEMRPSDPNRYTWLASAAAHFGQTEKELEYLGESVNLSPMNKDLRMKFADRLATAGEFKAAIENAEICRSLAPDDAQIEASLARFKTMTAAAKLKD